MKKITIASICTALLMSAFAYSEDFQILQTKEDGVVDGEYYVGSAYENITWGRLPNKNSKPVLTVPSGATVTIDTLSHEGMLED